MSLRHARSDSAEPCIVVTYKDCSSVIGVSRRRSSIPNVPCIARLLCFNYFSSFFSVALEMSSLSPLEKSQFNALTLQKPVHIPKRPTLACQFPQVDFAIQQRVLSWIQWPCFLSSMHMLNLFIERGTLCWGGNMAGQTLRSSQSSALIKVGIGFREAEWKAHRHRRPKFV